jgi:hypothetical protein
VAPIQVRTDVLPHGSKLSKSALGRRMMIWNVQLSWIFYGVSMSADGTDRMKLQSFKIAIDAPIWLSDWADELCLLRNEQ